jgi:hypothetical protein
MGTGSDIITGNHGTKTGTLGKMRFTDGHPKCAIFSWLLMWQPQQMYLAIVFAPCRCSKEGHPEP